MLKKKEDNNVIYFRDILSKHFNYYIVQHSKIVKNLDVNLLFV